MHLRDFLEKHGSQLASTIERNLTPVYNPLNPEGIEKFEEDAPGESNVGGGHPDSKIDSQIDQGKTGRRGGNSLLFGIEI